MIIWSQDKKEMKNQWTKSPMPLWRKEHTEEKWHWHVTNKESGHCKEEDSTVFKLSVNGPKLVLYGFTFKFNLNQA